MGMPSTSKKQLSYFRKRALQEWRGLPSEKQEDRGSSISEVLGKVVKKLGLQGRIKEEEVVGAWHEVVGDFLAKHSKPLQLAHGILYVQVLQPAIRYELDRVWKPEVLRKLQERFGTKVIRDMKFSF
jgi:predicted nucleic acid-binding Zn ribbon protein